MTLQILESRSTQLASTGIAIKYMKVKINNKIIELPQSCFSMGDYTKSVATDIPLSANLFQYYVYVGKNEKVINRIPRLLQNYNKVQENLHPRISDLNVHRSNNQVWTRKEREAVLNVQLEMETDFLSDAPFNYRIKKQNESATDYLKEFMIEFKATLNDLKDRKTDKIKSPTIRINIDDSIFAQQLENIAEHKFQRFNVEGGSVITHNENWRELSKFIVKNNIWCNMTGISLRRERNTLRSNMLLATAYGVNTMGLGRPPFQGPSDNKRVSYLFDKSTFKDVPQRVGDADECDIRSHNLIHKTINEAHKPIQDKTFYSNFVPNDFL